MEDPKKRKSTYRSRIKGLKQKAYELSTLCGVEAFGISFGPSGKADTWPENPQAIQDAIASYGTRSADARNRNKVDLLVFLGKEIKKSDLDCKTMDHTNLPTTEALDLQLGKVRERIKLLRSQRGLDMEPFDEVPCPDASNLEEVMASDGSYQESTDHFLLLPPRDTGFPQLPPELFLEEMITCSNDEAQESIDPFVDLTDLFPLPPMDTGYPHLPPEPCPDVSDYSQVVSDQDQFSTLFGLEDLLSPSPFGLFDSDLSCASGGFFELFTEDCLDVCDMMCVDDHDLMLRLPSGLNDGQDSGLPSQNSSESFASTWPLHAVDSNDLHYPGPTNYSYDGLQEI